MSRAVSIRSRRSMVQLARKRLLGVVAAVAVAVPALVLGSAAPASAAVRAIAFEAPNNNRVVLGELASRSQRKAVSISGIGPYLVRGTDSRAQQPYEFSTDFNYDPATSAWGRESDERALSAAGRYTSNTAASYAGRTNVLQLASSGNCTPNNQADLTYCSTFGPDIYTQPFQAVVGQAVSFDWAALRSSDDYEIYAYLVRVDGAGYGTPADHTLLTYGRGGTQGWTTTSRDIPADGTYRFRFVNGSYDKTGGLALGSNLYVDNTVKLGLSNPIAFAGLGDRIRTDPPFPITASAPGGAVGFTSSTSSVCTVSGATVTLTGTAGICTVLANQAGNSDYVPAETVARSFRVLTAPTAPTNAGRPFITGTVAEGETVTASEGTWTDGGSPVTGTTFQWVSTVGGTTTPISGETATTCYLVASPGSQLSVVVTKTNSVGSTSASSTPLNGYTCGQPAAPAWTTQTLGSAVVGSPLSVTFSASGVPAPSYSIAAGALPQGLVFDGATGTVSGTPSTAGPYTFTIQATNASGNADLSVSGTVNAAPGPITGSPDAFVVGVPATGSVSSDGTPAPGYLVIGGALPAGVILDPATGAFSGTPTAAGPYDFEISADNGIGTASTRRFTGDVAQAPGWQTQQGLRPELGVAVDVTFTAEGSPSPTYSIGSGALPAGLTLDSATGRITGTPTEAGPFSFTLVATNRAGSNPLLVEGLVVEAAGPIAGGPDGFEVGRSASAAVTSRGTPAPLFTITAGALPTGVTLDTVSGLFSGTPTVAGPYAFTVTADNGVGTTPPFRDYSGTVVQAPVFGPAPDLALEVGVGAQAAFSATAFPSPVYAIAAGALPAGLVLDPATGAVTGTPTVAGPYSFTLSATNDVGDAATLEVTGIVVAAPTWWDIAIGSPRVGAAFSDAVAAYGTPAPGYTVTAGRLPAGLALNALTGAITGTPTESGSFAFTITAANGVGTPAAQAFAVDVVQPPVETTTPLGRPSLVAGRTISIDLGSGVAAFPAPTYRLTSGELPAGITLDEATGRLSGTPTAPGDYFFAITVDNGTGAPLVLEFSGAVAGQTTDGPSGAGERPTGLAATGADGVPPILALALLLVLGGSAISFVVRPRRRRVI